MRTASLACVAALAVAGCAAPQRGDPPDLKPVDAINAGELNPSCSQSSLLLPIGYNLKEFPGEVAYYTTIKVDCDGLAIVIAEERGRASRDSNGASLRVFIGPKGIEPVRELCRKNDGNLTPAGTRYIGPSGYWSKQSDFRTYNLRCRNADYGDDYIPVPIKKGVATQFTFLRWNKNADPFDPVAQNVILHIQFVPKGQMPLGRSER